MRTQIKKWLALACMAFALKNALVAQNGPCTPLPPPSWINIINITASSAVAQWEPVQAGAWYRVELRNLNSGFVEDLSFIQTTSKSYTNLAAGTSYRVTVQASPCQQGPYGQGSSADFETVGIVIEDIVFIDQGMGAPNLQVGFNNAHTVSPTDIFFICIREGTIPISDLDYVLHAYIAPEGNDDDFFEFFMAANTGDNKAYFDSAPLGFPFRKWRHRGVGGGNLGFQVFSSIFVEYYNAQNEWETAMEIKTTTIASPPGYIMLQVIMGGNFLFTYDQNRRSGSCAFGATKQAPEHNPNTFVPKDQLRGIFPNPFTDHLNIPDFDPNAGPATLRVMDATGRLLFEASDPDAANITRRIHTADWQPGLYFVQIQTATGATTTPVVKM